MKITRVQLKLLQKRARLHNLNSDNFIGCDLSNEMFTMTFAVAEEKMQDLSIVFHKHRNPEIYISEPYSHGNAEIEV